MQNDFRWGSKASSTESRVRVLSPLGREQHLRTSRPRHVVGVSTYGCWGEVPRVLCICCIAVMSSVCGACHRHGDDKFSRFPETTFFGLSVMVGVSFKWCHDEHQEIDSTTCINISLNLPRLLSVSTDTRNQTWYLECWHRSPKPNIVWWSLIVFFLFLWLQKFYITYLCKIVKCERRKNLELFKR